MLLKIDINLEYWHKEDNALLFPEETVSHCPQFAHDFLTSPYTCLPFSKSMIRQGSAYSLSIKVRWTFCVNLTRNLGLVLLDFSLSVKAATLISISGCGSAISSAKERKSGFIFCLLKSK